MRTMSAEACINLSGAKGPVLWAATEEEKVRAARASVKYVVENMMILELCLRCG